MRTLRAQLLANLSTPDTDSLDALNRRLWAWVEAEYHHSPHRGLDGQTPLDRWVMSEQPPRLPGPKLGLAQSGSWARTPTVILILCAESPGTRWAQDRHKAKRRPQGRR